MSNEITSIPSSLKDSQRREGVRGGVHKIFKGSKGPRGASYMDQHGANEPKGGLLIWTSMCPMNQRGASGRSLVVLLGLVPRGAFPGRSLVVLLGLGPRGASYMD